MHNNAVNKLRKCICTLNCHLKYKITSTYILTLLLLGDNFYASFSRTPIVILENGSSVSRIEMESSWQELYCRLCCHWLCHLRPTTASLQDFLSLSIKGDSWIWKPTISEHCHSPDYDVEIITKSLRNLEDSHTFYNMVVNRLIIIQPSAKSLIFTSSMNLRKNKWHKLADT